MFKSPSHSPKESALVERVIEIIRRERLDWLIPLSEPKLQSILKVRATHCNEARPHLALDSGAPDPTVGAVLGARAVVCARSLLDRLHHECSLAPALA